MYLNILKKDLKRKKGNERNTAGIHYTCNNVRFLKCK